MPPVVSQGQSAISTVLVEEKRFFLFFFWLKTYFFKLVEIMSFWGYVFWGFIGLKVYRLVFLSLFKSLVYKV